MVSLLLSFLKANWLVLIIILLMLAIGAGGGYLVTKRLDQSAIDAANDATATVQKDFAAFKLDTQKAATAEAKQHADELTAANKLAAQYQQRADELSSELLANEYKLAQAREAFQRSIANVIAQDGAHYNGIGPNSLCLYRSALGYPGCDKRLPDADGSHADDTGHAGTTGGGLSPAGLLNHASSYGAWCQTLKSKLDSIKALYAKLAATGGK